MRGLCPLSLVPGDGSRVLRQTVERLVPVAGLGDDLIDGVWRRDAVILRPLRPLDSTLGTPHFSVKFINFPEFPVNIIKFRVSGVNTVVTRTRGTRGRGLDLTQGGRSAGEGAGQAAEQTRLSSQDCCRLLLLLFHSESLDS